MFKKPIIQVPLKYGAIASGLLALLFTLLFFAGKHPLFIPVYLDIRLLILPVFMFFAMKDFRDNSNSGTLHFWQGLSIGFITFITIGLLVAIFVMLFATISSSFLIQYIEARTELLHTYQQQLTEAMNEDFIQDQLYALPLTRPTDLATDYFLKTIAIGIFLNIILAVILRKQP